MAARPLRGLVATASGKWMPGQPRVPLSAPTPPLVADELASLYHVAVIIALLPAFVLCLLPMELS
jgi:uncharacterized RDD family membrane protein YckC